MDSGLLASISLRIVLVFSLKGLRAGICGLGDPLFASAPGFANV